MDLFKEWLRERCDYSDRTISNTISRVRRADRILKIHFDNVYIYELEQEPEFNSLTSSVRSQLKRAVSLFIEYKSEETSSINNQKRNVLSLFSNIGVAEAYLKENNFPVVVANEIDKRRSQLFNQLYPETYMINGDITENIIFNEIVQKSRERNVEIIIATPPCQGISTVGQRKKFDDRNELFLPVLEIIKELEPNYVMFENVPLFLSTEVMHNKKLMQIQDVINLEVGDQYEIRKYITDMQNYSVPQSRERAIVLLTKKGKCLKPWTLPETDKKILTMEEAIGDLPSLDPEITDMSEEEMLSIFPTYYEKKEKALEYSKWHTPPTHIARQVKAMRYTPTGKSAFENEIYYPKKENGERVKGFKNTYKRQNWDTPAYTVTMDNRKISSQENVHPGRFEGQDSDGYPMYSDARALTLYELMLIMTLPDDWPIPEDTSEAFLRRVIGEGIPPLFVKKIFCNLN